MESAELVASFLRNFHRERSGETLLAVDGLLVAIVFIGCQAYICAVYYRVDDNHSLL